ncbi:MAG: MFS transporter [Bdellovibrionota bacterium]
MNRKPFYVISGVGLAHIAFSSAQFAFPLLILSITSSSIYVTNLNTINFLPAILFGVVVGAIVDRFDQRKLMYSTYVLQGAALYLVALILWLFGNDKSIAFIFLGYLLYIFANYGALCTFNGVIKSFGSGDSIVKINSKLSFLKSAVAILAPISTGYFMDILNEKYLFIALGTLYFVAASISRNYPYIEQEKVKHQTKLGNKIIEGFKYLYGNKNLLSLGIIVCLMNTTVAIATPLLTYHTKINFGFSSAKIGLLFSFGTCGALLGSYLAGRIRVSMDYISELLITTNLLQGVCYGGIAIAVSFHSLIFWLVLLELITVIQSIFVWSYRQAETDKAYIGRVSGILGSLFKLCIPISLFISGKLEQLANVKYVLIVAMLVNLFISLMIPLFPGFRLRIFRKFKNS